MDLLLLLPVWCLMAVVGYYIGRSKGSPGMGALMGFLLGPIGWLVTLAFSDSRPKCPLCGGRLEALGVSRCRHCGGDIGMAMQRMKAPGMPVVEDPMEAWERQERIKKGLSSLPPRVKQEAEEGA